LLAASVAALGCGRRRATGFPGYCLVANQGTRSLAAVDLNRFAVRTQIPLDAAPGTVLAHPDAATRRAFVLAPDAGAVYEIDTAGLKKARSIDAGDQALGMRYSPSGDALWVLYREPASLVEIPLKSFRPGRRIHLPAPPDTFDVSADGRAAIASRQGRRIVVASLARGAVERSIDSDEPSIVFFRKDGKHVLAGNADRTLTIFETATGKTVVRLPLPLAPRQFCATPDQWGGQIFVSGDGMDGVVIVFPYTTDVGETILAGHAPGVMTVTDTSPSYLLAANPGSGAVTAIDVDTRRLLAVVRVGEQPGAILLTPDKQYALVLNEKSGDMAVIRMVTFTEAWVRRYKSASLFTMIPVGERPVSAAVVQAG
jgi:YVTN family beta-propeller protein